MPEHKPLTDKKLARIEAYCEAASPTTGHAKYLGDGNWQVVTPLNYRMLAKFIGKNAQANARLFAQARTDLPAVVADLRELREAAGPFAAEAPGPTQGLDSIGDGAKVELWLEIQSTMARFGEFTLGDLRRLGALVEEGK